MKLCCAFILLLGVGYNVSAQTRLPTQHRPALKDGTSQEQTKPYEGRQIRSLEFRGNQHVLTESIREVMTVKEGDSYNAERLDSDMDRLRVLLFARRGYLKAKLEEPRVEDSPSGLDIVVTVHEGTVYRLGEIKVEDATIFSPEDIIQIIGLKSGEVVDGYGFQLGLSKLSKLYRDRGYFQFNAGFIPDFKQDSPDAEGGVVDIALELEEGELFRINRIQFEGNAQTADRVVRRQLRINEGDVYDESLLQESLSRLNSLGLFEHLTLEHAGLHKNSNRGLLDITIHLTEKGRD